MSQASAIAAERFYLEAAAALLAADEPKADNPYLRDPVGWINQRLGEHVWSKQGQIAESVAANRRTAVHSCHGAGKSFIASRLACWWIDVHDPGDAFVVTTAPTAPQVRAILWREIRKAHQKGQLGGRLNQTEWWINDEMVAFGRKPSDYDQAAFQGIHAPRVLVILDEGGGIPADLYRAANSLAANEHSRILAIGNPDDPQTHFATVCGIDSGWHVVHVDAFDTPNFTGETIPEKLKEDLISHVYVDELKRDVGEGSPIYLAKVRGLFPKDQADGVVPLSWVKACQLLDREYGPADLVPVELGVDVGAGGDETVIRERRGMVAGRTWRYRTPESTQAAGYVVLAIRETGATRVKIDSIGIGWGIVGRLRELRDEGEHHAEIVAVNVGAASTDPKRFRKLRDQLWWEIGRKLSESRAWDLAAVDDTTVAQLIAPTWKPDSAGRHQVERKADTKQRLQRSPDDADALILCYYAPASAASASAEPSRDSYHAERRRTI